LAIWGVSQPYFTQPSSLLASKKWFLPLNLIRFTKLNVPNRRHRQPPLTEADYRGRRSIIEGDLKLVVKEDSQGGLQQALFDLRADPAEEANIVEERPETAQRLGTKLREWQQSVLNSLRGEDYEK